ncbi:MAG: monovalent cation/H(+) antiporter subunit G [Pseudomonadota bacterium]
MNWADALDTALWAASWFLLTVGSGFVLVGGIGAVRMPNLYTRVHASSLTDSLGPVLILGGLMLQSGLTLETLKLFAILVFMLITGPTATYALGNAALLAGIQPQAERRSER